MLGIEKGLIIKATGGFYYVETPLAIIECRAKGLFRKKDITPLVGDRVEIELTDEKTGTVSKILQRKNQLTRPPLANLDKIFVVTSIVEPVPNTTVLDHFIAVCEYKNINPIIIVTKDDLGDTTDFAKIYTNAGFKVISVNKFDDSKVDLIKDEMRDSISAFTGNTGVGKSSFLNLLYPNLNIETAKISQKLGRGKHTTRHVELYKFDDINAYVADTPGFTTMDFLKYDIILKENIQHCFREFAEYENQCKFTGCSHTVEKGCVILQALKENKIEKSRHESYVSMYNEAKEIKEWEIKK